MGVSGDHVTLPTLCHALSTLHARAAHARPQRLLRRLFQGVRSLESQMIILRKKAKNKVKIEEYDNGNSYIHNTTDTHINKAVKYIITSYNILKNTH